MVCPCVGTFDCREGILGHCLLALVGEAWGRLILDRSAPGMLLMVSMLAVAGMTAVAAVDKLVIPVEHRLGGPGWVGIEATWASLA